MTFIFEGSVIAIGMIIDRDKVSILVSPHVCDHFDQCIWEIEIVVFGKINEFSVRLVCQDLDLPLEGLYSYVESSRRIMDPRGDHGLRRRCDGHGGADRTVAGAGTA